MLDMYLNAQFNIGLRKFTADQANREEKDMKNRLFFKIGIMALISIFMVSVYGCGLFSPYEGKKKKKGGKGGKGGGNKKKKGGGGGRKGGGGGGQQNTAGSGGGGGGGGTWTNQSLW
jgi:hypothetical protein